MALELVTKEVGFGPILLFESRRKEMKSRKSEIITKCITFYKSMYFNVISLIPLIFWFIFEKRLDKKDTKNIKLY